MPKKPITLSEYDKKKVGNSTTLQTSCALCRGGCEEWYPASKMFCQDKPICKDCLDG